MLTFWLLAFVMVIGALGVVFLRQPVHAALSLVGTLLTLAVLFVTLHAHFLAAIQVLVYAGAIMVLFLFVIMLLNLGEDTPRERGAMRWAAYGVGVLTAGALVAGALLDPRTAPDPAVVRAALQGGAAEFIADVLFGEMMLAFHLVGVLLLTGMVGAVALVQRSTATDGGATSPSAASAPAAPSVPSVPAVPSARSASSTDGRGR